MAESLFDKLESQRPREDVVNDFETAHVLREDKKYWYDEHTRQERTNRLMLEVLLDIRDRLAEMREWLPSEVDDDVTLEY